MPLLVVEDIHKRYGEEEVLQGVSFGLAAGETKVIIGPSGTGKTTLLRCINQLTKPDRGRVWLGEHEVTSPKTDIYRIRAQIGFVFQSFNLFAHLTALENIRLGLIRVKRIGKNEATERAKKELAQVGMIEKTGAYPAELSGGQQQRVAIARALAMDPKLILFDEPTSALDPELIGEVLEVIIELARAGITMLVVTHEMGFARSVANEVIFMEGGRIVEQAPPGKLFASPEHSRTAKFLRKLSDLYGQEG